MKIFKKKRIEPPHWGGFETFVTTVSVFLMFTAFFGGVQLVTGALVGFGFVVGVLIVMMKIPFMKMVIFKYSKQIDIIYLFGGMLFAGSSFGLLVATYSGVFLSAFLAIYEYNYRKQHYMENK